MAFVNITSDNYHKEVMEAEKPVLIDFWASWCGPCKMLSPIIDEIAEEIEDVKICKVDIDKEPELTSKFDVTSVPTVVLVKNGKVVETSVGLKPKSAILDMLHA